MADRLDRYRSKRDPGLTPEPFGAVRGGGAGGRLFVVQQHAARRLHWDFRLELHGTLRSWAVPKGPSADPADKRMAVEVEDHPIEYADFEGLIPKGEYGGGSVIVWDRGWWRPLEDPDEGYEKGKLLFLLGGYKLRGEWTLVRTRSAKEWLLLKHRDAFADPGSTRPFPAVSVLSGRTLEEVAGGVPRVAGALARAESLGARRRAVRPDHAALMLAAPVDVPFRREGWLFELKYDGYRLLAERSAEGAVLRYRRGGDATSLFPEVARAVASLPAEALLDGEVVVLDEAGRPDFQALQARAQLRRPADVAAASVLKPATLFAFDLLAAGGLDLRPLPLTERKAVLAALAPRLGPVRLADHVEVEGEALYREVTARGLEGVVAKKADSPYRAGRSADWQKVRTARTADLAVVGFTRAQGARNGFGALHVAARGEEGLVYAGRVGSGFDEALLEALATRLAAHERKTPACGGAVPRGAGHRWVEPELVVEVRFKDWTKEGLMRQPVFLRLRDDKRPSEVDAAPEARESPPPAAEEAPPAAAGPVEISNRSKVYFPRDGITKGEIVDYYRAVAPAMLPYLRDRPVVLTRYPDGIDGKSFFQKDARWRPDWLRTVTVHSEDSNRDLELPLLEDAEGLAWVANLGAIPIHVMASRASAMERPDWLIVDLDPKEAPFAHVVRLALAVRALCDAIGLPCFAKTSGQKGMHVLAPTGGQLTHDQARGLAVLLCQEVEARHPDLATTARALSARGGRVYLDALQNGRGKTIAAPFCVRPRDGAPVSTPLRWSEVNGKLDPARFTVRNTLKRLARLGEDPLRGVLEARPELLSVLERLHGQVERDKAAGEARTRR